tara:strand:+ start:2046 stop:2507 length:462 start_codon:yes stop_codon:yes gene_type:complete
MKQLALFTAVLLLVSCEKKDDLGPYVEQIKPLEKYHQTLLQYKEYLASDETVEKAHDLKKVFENYRADLEKIPKPEDKKVGSQHNAILRVLDQKILRRLADPEDHTIPGQFILDGRNRIKDIEDFITKSYYGNLEKLWRDAGKSEPFPLKWPE